MKAPFRAPPLLQEAWIRRLGWHFAFYNHAYARRVLRPPIILIGSSGDRLGEWNPRDRTITISERHILEHSWESVLDTLRHEMAHQLVDEVLCAQGAPPHGEAFGKACWMLRVDPSRSPRPGALDTLEESPEVRDKALQRIKELLAMAGSPNEHEAANAMRLVQKYLLRYNLDLAEVNRPRSFAVRHLGRSSAKIQEYEYTLSSILEQHYFVEVVWVFSYDPLRNRPGRILQVVGTPENLEIAEYVHRYVMGLTEGLWRAYRASSGARGTARSQYLAGLLRGLQEKLDRSRQELCQERGLVWSGDPQLQEFFRYINPRLSRIGGSGAFRGRDFAGGLRDGGKITIRRGIGGETVNRGRLLGDGS